MLTATLSYEFRCTRILIGLGILASSITLGRYRLNQRQSCGGGFVRQSVFSFSGSSWLERARRFPYRGRDSVLLETHEWCPNRVQETRVVSPLVRGWKQRAPSTRAPTQELVKAKTFGEKTTVFLLGVLALVQLCVCLSSCLSRVVRALLGR